MSLVSVLITVVLVGLIAWIITLIPMPEPFRTIAWVVLALILLVWIASGFGVVHLR